MESISTNAKDANGEAGEVPHLVSDPAAPRRARTDEVRRVRRLDVSNKYVLLCQYTSHTVM